MKFFLIAELGVNWGGSKAIMHEMMSQAKSSGADAVKFQAFLPEHVAGLPDAEKLLASSLNVGMAEYAEAASKSMKIPWFCTPFYPEAVDWLEEFDVPYYKVREKDAREIRDIDHPLLARILATDKEVFVSTQSVPLSPLSLRYNPRIRWLYCLPQYPPKFEDIDFGKAGLYGGYSNHYPGLIAPLAAAIRGARIIEVHVTISKEWNCPDRAVSLDFRELKQLTDYLRILETEKHEPGE